MTVPIHPDGIYCELPLHHLQLVDTEGMADPQNFLALSEELC